MSKNNTQAAKSSLVDRSTFIDSATDEFVEISLGDSNQKAPLQWTPVGDGLGDFDDIFVDELQDEREVRSAVYLSDKKAKVVLTSRKGLKDKACCQTRNCCVGTLSSVLLLAQKIPLAYAFIMMEKDWAYGVVPGLLLLSFIEDYLITSSRAHDLLKTDANVNIKTLYKNSKIPKLPKSDNKYGITQMLFSTLGVLASSALFGWAETSVVSPTVNSIVFNVAFCILASTARVINGLEAESIASMSHYLLASDTARTPIFPAFIAEVGARITYFRDYLSCLKSAISAVVCFYIATSFELPQEFLANTLMGGLVMFLGIMAMMGDNYRTNRLNIKKQGLSPKGTCDQVSRQVLNLAIPYHLVEGITSIYRRSISGKEKAIYAIPPLVLALSIASGAISFLEDTGISIGGSLSLNALLLGLSAVMGCLALLAFVSIRYESAVSLVTGRAYDALLSAYWMTKMSEHPVAQDLLGMASETDMDTSVIVLSVMFMVVMLTTSHTAYYSDQVIATKALSRNQNSHSTPKQQIQMRDRAGSFDSPPSWRNSLFRERSGSSPKASTLAMVTQRLDFRSAEVNV